MNTTDTPSGEPKLAGFVSWLVLGASFALSAATWVALAELADFTATASVGPVTLRLAWLMPIAVDGYVVVSLVTWMAPVPARVAAFARKNTYAAAAIGVVAQSCFHTLTVWTDTGTVWRAVLAAVVGALPPAVAGLAVHMRALIRRESGRDVAADVPPEASQVVAPARAVEVPPAAPARTGSPRKRAPAKATRRPAEQTRQLAADLMDAEPGITRAEVARRLKVTPRRLRDVLNEAAEPRTSAPADDEPVPHNGVHPELVDVLTASTPSE